MSWEKIRPMRAEPASLTGYALEAHQFSRGTCLYCGLSAEKAVDAEVGFDLWRQLAAEHVIPGEVMAQIQLEKCIAAALPNVDSGKLADHIMRRMNIVTTCHLCNTFVGHWKKKPEVKDAVQKFCDFINEQHKSSAAAHMPEATKKWLEIVASAILRVWDAKAKYARGKTVYMRKVYVEALGAKLAPVRPGDCDLLDRKAEKWITSECLKVGIDSCLPG